MARAPSGPLFDGKLKRRKALLLAQLAKLEPGPARDIVEAKIREIDLKAGYNHYLDSTDLETPDEQ